MGSNYATIRLPRYTSYPQLRYLALAGYIPNLDQRRYTTPVEDIART
jgi:hypothetical protein